MKTLAYFLPIQEMLQEALDFSEKFWGRWDVPHGKDTTPDLDDRIGILPVMEDKRSKSSLILTEEACDESIFNPVTVALVSILPFLAALIALASGIDAPKAQAIAVAGTTLLAIAGVITVVLVMNKCREKFWDVFQTVGVSFGLPMVGLALQSISGAAVASLNQGAAGLTPGALAGAAGFGALSLILSLWITLMMLLWIIQFFSARAEKPLSEMVTFTLTAIGVIGTGIILTVPFLACLVVAVMAPNRIVKRWKKKRAARLVSLGLQFGGQGAERNVTAHIESRKDQAERAKADTTPLIHFGVSLGQMYNRNDVYAAQQGLPMVASINDLSTHSITFGKPGKGKSEYVSKRKLTQYIIADLCGLCYIDPKSDGARDYMHLPGYTLVTPKNAVEVNGERTYEGVTINLLEGLDRELIIETIAEVFAKENPNMKGSDPFFVPKAKALAFHSANILHHFIEAMKDRGEYDDHNQWFFNVLPLKKMCKTVAEVEVGGLRSIEPILRYIELHTPEGDRDPVLNSSIEYARYSVPEEAKSDKTWTGIVGTLDPWFDSLLNSSKIMPWCASRRSDFDVLSCLHGGKFGLHLPLSFGVAGKMAMALIRRRIATEALKRSSGTWRQLDPTATPVLFHIDEVQEVWNELDQRMLSMGRGIGCWCDLMTQSRASLEARLGKSETAMMLGNIQNKVYLDVDEETFHDAQQEAGKCYKNELTGMAPAIDFWKTVRAIKSGPLRDREHPNYDKHWEYMAAQGYGLAVPEKLERRIMQTQEIRMADFDDTMDFFTKRNLLTTTITMHNGKENYILEQSDFDVLSKGNGNALVMISRGGVDRRDFVKFQRFPVPSRAQFDAWKAHYQATGKIDLTRNIDKE